MFARVFALLPLALLASASHLEARQTCSTADQYCCSSTQTAQQFLSAFPTFSNIFAGVGANVVLGLACSSLSVVAVGGNSCTQQTVCCENNDFNGLVNVGCSPINVGA